MFTQLGFSHSRGSHQNPSMSPPEWETNQIQSQSWPSAQDSHRTVLIQLESHNMSWGTPGFGPLYALTLEHSLLNVLLSTVGVSS